MQVLVMCVFWGIVAGFGYSFLHFFVTLLRNKKLLVIIADLVSSLFAGAIFIFCVVKYNFGIIRLFIVCGFALGILVEIVSIGNLLDFLANYIYTKFRYIANKLSCKFKKKVRKNEPRTTKPTC